jgi:hypothetical protein
MPVTEAAAARASDVALGPLEHDDQSNELTTRIENRNQRWVRMPRKKPCPLRQSIVFAKRGVEK